MDIKVYVGGEDDVLTDAYWRILGYVVVRLMVEGIHKVVVRHRWWCDGIQ